MEKLVEYYDETKLEYISRIVNSIMKNSINKSKISINEAIRNINQDPASKEKFDSFKKMSFIIIFGVSAMTKAIYPREINDDKEMAQEVEETISLSDAILQAGATVDNVKNDTSKYVSVNEDLIGIAQDMAKLPQKEADKLLCKYYEKEDSRQFADLFKTYMFAIDKPYETLEDYVIKYENYTSVEEWIENVKKTTEYDDAKKDPSYYDITLGR